MNAACGDVYRRASGYTPANFGTLQNVCGRPAAHQGFTFVPAAIKLNGKSFSTGHYLRENMRDEQKLLYAGRPPSAAPATGYMARHNERQKQLVEQAFGKYK